MDSSINHRLCTLRKEAGLSQERLAQELGVTRLTLAGYERGKRPPDCGFIVRAAKFFNCTPDYLLGVSPFKNNDHYRQFSSATGALGAAAALASLPEGERRQLITSLNTILQQDGCTVDSFIDLLSPFTHIFQIAQTPGTAVDLALYRTLENHKSQILETINTLINSLTPFKASP